MRAHRLHGFPLARPYIVSAATTLLARGRGPSELRRPISCSEPLGNEPTQETPCGAAC
jgi:hypothetical protein